jgi:CII-binding regulator of phage lambda lysogenization HflD
LAASILDPTQHNDEKPPAKSRWNPQALIYKFTLTAYRIVAILVLYAVLLGILAYAWIMGFYAVNSSWAAPVIFSSSDEKSLDFMQKLVLSRQSIEDIKVDIVRQQTTLAEMDKYRASLQALDRELQTAIATKRDHDQLTGPQLAALDKQKQADNRKTQQLLTQIHQIEEQIKSDLGAGLITKGDAATQLAQLSQAETAYTDSRIADVMLSDDVLDKTTIGTKSLEALEKQAELRSDIAQLDVTLSVAEKQLQEDNRQVDRLHDAIAIAKQSPYYLNSSGGQRLYFAFVPYDNQASAAVGAPIYDCYLNMVLCRKVGTVKQIFLGEQVINHPIFKSQVRGLTILMNLSHPESAKSQTVFLGRKPLLF